jgi:hypothetical protein
VGIVYIGLNLGLPKMILGKLPSTYGLNTETFCFANLLFFAPFVLGFLTGASACAATPRAIRTDCTHERTAYLQAHMTVVCQPAD